MRVGLISDTHGLLRPEAIRFLNGSKLIIHAGDIGHGEILEDLREIAPLIAVRGNNDKGNWADALPGSEVSQIGEYLIFVLHDRAELEIDPAAAGIHVVISGHSHQPRIQERDCVLYLNPGSAGPRRFKLPITAAELIFSDGKVSARIFDLATQEFIRPVFESSQGRWSTG